jgi:predicted nucleic acid-binding protein
MTNGIIVDSSVWVDYFNGILNKETNLADELIFHNKALLLPIILQEVLQGIREYSLFVEIKKSFLAYEFIEYNQIQMSIDAAAIYRVVRRKGITVRKPNDCLIAAICIENNISLLHKDRDFNQIAKHTSLQICK